MIEWSWRVEMPRSIAFGSWDSDARMNNGIRSLIGASIEAINVTGRIPELEINLTDGRRIQSFATAGGQPQWTVFLRDGSWLHVERGRVIQNRAAGG